MLSTCTVLEAIQCILRPINCFHTVSITQNVSTFFVYTPLQCIQIIITVPPALANARETVEEMIVHTNQLVLLAQGLCLEVPEGPFNQSAAQTLDTLHYLKARIHGMDPLTGGAQDISPGDYMSDPHVQVKRKRRGQPFPQLRKQRGFDVGEEEEGEEEEEEEDMDVEQILAETPSVGNKPLDSPYPYKCYRVDINNPKYDTKQDPPSGSWAPISPQCYCGVQCTDAGDLATHKSNSHPGNTNWKCSQCDTTCQDKRAVWKHFRNFHLHVFIHLCSFDNCSSGFQGDTYGNDEQPPVWWHMDQVHKLPTALGCPTCEKRVCQPHFPKETH